jgi:2-polyprenyl-6-methoxyphenol hydroxylase-like FAD-dependent oxidoreductase
MIVGGGLAGLVLGIGLRRRDVPVTVHDAGHYPRHRVCGEFISGRGQATLARLGLRERVNQAGAVSAQTVAFFSANRSTRARPLPSPAIALSRFALDAMLADQLRELGGMLIESSRFAEICGEGIVRATGRRPRAGDGGPRWFGLKIHARKVALVADLEMHLAPAGYVGLCNLNDGEVNVCGLFHKRPDGSAETTNWRHWLCGREGSPLSRRLADAEFDEASYCAIAGLSLRPQRAAARMEVCVGDAITMIPPITGNGMSMAFESAELAIAPLAAWSRGDLAWSEARRQIVGDCDAAFARRLAWASWLQRIVLMPALQNPVVALAARSDGFWRTAFERTR